ncbi:MAG: phosphoribosylaminoimidazolesuccinocarboxamide synthase, partial [bacterium]
IIEWDGAHLVTNDEQKSWLKGRSVVVQKLKPLPVEAIVRGYIIGSGWKDYLNSGAICGIELPEGLQQAEQLKNPLFTPSSKADVGDHDINISFDKMIKLIGSELAHQVRDVSLGIYQFAVELAEKAGIIIADTKFEFGLDKDNQLVLMDEVLTPDSSRFWPQESYRIGTSPASYDKQFVRDYLETLDWNKTTPGPKIPQEIIEQTAKLYEQAYTRLSKLG